MREGLGGHRISTQRARRDWIRARRTTEPEIDATREKRFECAELLGDEQWRVIRQHDAASANANGRRATGNMCNHDRCGSTGNTRDTVMLGDPDAMVAEPFGVARQIERIMKRLRRRPSLHDRREVEHGQGDCGETGSAHAEA